ncbi:MAG: hypothetical protein KDB90_04560 [Planctomycetes bacterium]|nr:hypothetical protein [Planctomycetota bacterium]
MEIPTWCPVLVAVSAYCLLAALAFVASEPVEGSAYAALVIKQLAEWLKR